MYSKIFGSSIGGVRGTYHAPGMDHVYYVNNNGATGASLGQIQRVRVTPLEQVSEGSGRIITATPESQIYLDAGLWDIRWTTVAATGQSNSLPKIVRNGSVTLYKYATAPSGGLGSIDPASLPGLAYSSNALLEDGKGDNYYAARLGTTSPNYAVFRIYKDPADATKTKFDWITYKLNTNADIVGFGYDDPRDIVLSADLMTAYISARDEFGQCRILAVPNHPNPTTPAIPKFDVSGSSSSFAVDDPSKLLDDVQQIALHNGKIYAVDAAALWCIDESAQTQTQIVAIPNGGMGLLIDDDGIAIITDRTGALLEVDLNDASPDVVQLPPPLITLPGSTGFLSWADESKMAFYVTVLQPENTVYLVNLANPAISPIIELNNLSPAVGDPFSVEVISPTRLLIASDKELGSLNLTITSNDLVLGIGLVPFTYIIQDPASSDRGRADTTPAKGYFYQVSKVPFGGSLNLMINHAKAQTLGITHYRVTFKNLKTGASRDVVDPFTDLLWLQVGGKPGWYASPVASTGLTPAAPIPKNAFPVRKPTDLWYNPYLSAILHTKIGDNGLNEITFRFYNQSGVEVTAETKTYVVLIDNNPCNAAIYLPRMGNPPAPAPGYPVLDCGCIMYADKDDKVELDFSAWQLEGQGVYTLSIYRGGVYLPALAQSGPVDSSSTVRTKHKLTQYSYLKVGHFTGDCNIAGITVQLSVPPRVIDGYRWLPSSHAYARRDFTLVPNTVPMSSPWTDPEGD
ncbi:hypothetical protein [Polyangium aurulentum]|uniref:hypothetical protein n=1 Tax=Polyangium aurulentum TaxID=2567896 RepID=UPI0010ADE6AB|nr:hypothetical protein [Polyangium aurulentum]UQA58653.1 hypothetical protein E8A73_046700 [Polyangium aurulentum]